MGRKSHFNELKSRLRIPAKAAVAGIPPVYRAVCRMAQGLLTQGPCIRLIPLPLIETTVYPGSDAGRRG